MKKPLEACGVAIVVWALLTCGVTLLLGLMWAGAGVVDYFTDYTAPRFPWFIVDALSGAFMFIGIIVGTIVAYDETEKRDG